MLLNRFVVSSSGILALRDPFLKYYEGLFPPILLPTGMIGDWELWVSMVSEGPSKFGGNK